MATEHNAYDNVLREIGGFGRWQKWIYFWISFSSLAAALSTVCQSFLIYEPRYRCVVDHCDLQGRDSDFQAAHNDFTIPFWDEDEDPEDSDDKEEASCTHFLYIGDPAMESCLEGDFDGTQTVACSKHIYDESEYENSLVTELDLGTCEHEDEDWHLYPVITRISLLGMGYATGQVFAGIINGYLSDRWGRLNVLLVNNFFSFIFMFVSSFIADYWTFYALRVLAGVASFGFAAAFMISVEIVSVEYRMILGILINVPYAMGEMVVALCSYLFQDWGTNQMVMSFFSLACCLLYFVVPESPRWLLSEGKTERAKKVFQKGATANKKTISPETLEAITNMKESKEEQVEQLGFASLFQDWKVSSITLIMWCNWTATTLCYYGLGFSSVDLSGDIYVSFFLSALIEIPSYVFCALVLDGWGRKSVLMFCQFLAGVCCVLAGVIDHDTLTTVFSLAGKFGAAGCFAIIYQYTAELYPTQIRTIAVGSSSMAGRFGSIVAPVIVVIEPSSIPLSIMGIVALVAGALAVFLPETLGMPLPERMDDIYGLYKNKKKWWKWITKKELKRLQEEAETK